MLFRSSTFQNKYDFSSLSASSTVVVHIGTNISLKVFESNAWIYIPSKSTNIYRIGCYSFASEAMNSNIEGQSLYVELSDSTVNPINETLEFMNHHFGLAAQNIETISMSTLKPAYVHFNAKAKSIVDGIKTELSAHDIYLTGRYGNWDYVSMEDCKIGRASCRERV